MPHLTDKQRRAQLNGSVKTPNKAAASRANGKLGGRPKMPRCKNCETIIRNNQCSCTVIAAQRGEYINGD